MATKTLANFQQAVNELLAIVSEGDDTEGVLARRQAIYAALERYSVDRPDLTTDDLTGDAGRFYDLTGGSASFSAFVDGFSHITKIEYPAYAVSADHAPVYLDPEDWDADYWAAGVRYLRFPNHAPAATETVRVTFTAPYVFSSGSVTIPSQDYQAICHLAAGLACEYYAMRYSRTSDSTISADSVDHPTRAQAFSSRARELIDYYENHMRLGDDGDSQQAAGEFVDLDTAPGWPVGRDYLFHGRNTR